MINTENGAAPSCWQTRCLTFTIPSSRCVPQREAGVWPGKLKLGSFVHPAVDEPALAAFWRQAQTVAEEPMRKLLCLIFQIKLAYAKNESTNLTVYTLEV